MQTLSNYATEMLDKSKNASLSGLNTDELLSKLLRSYVERQISAHTIADVLRTQIIDNNGHADGLSVATANGVIEVLIAETNAQLNNDILLFFAARNDFPGFLSLRATAGLMLSFLKHLPLMHERTHGTKLARMGNILQKLAEHFLSFESLQNSLFGMERARVLNACKQLPENLRAIMQSWWPALQGNKNINTPSLMRELQTKSEWLPEEIIRTIIASPEHVLAQKGIASFRLANHLQPANWKINNFSSVIENIASSDLSSFRRSFLVEWFFDGLLRETLTFPELSSSVGDCLRNAVENYGLLDGVLKGTLRALQHDISLTSIEGTTSSLGKEARCGELIARAQPFFQYLLVTANKNLAQISKDFAVWALQLAVNPPESRLFTRNSWQWIRVLVSGQWVDDLREPPSWLLAQTNRYAAPIFRIAPHFWLQEHAHLLVERLYSETMLPTFSQSIQHTNYIEFLCRTLRKKSPLFASRHETLLVLRLLSRTSPSEENQLSLLETRMKLISTEKAAFSTEKQFWNDTFRQSKRSESFANSHISQALNVLLYVCRMVAKSKMSSSQAIF